MPRRPDVVCGCPVADALARPAPIDCKPSAAAPVFDLATAGQPWAPMRLILHASVLQDASFGFEQPRPRFPPCWRGLAALVRASSAALMTP